MARRLVLHVGLMKSGTSFVQHVLQTNHEVLRQRDVLFPGGRFRAQVHAVHDITQHGGPHQQPLPEDGPWRSLVAEIDAWPEVAVVSMEFLGPRSGAKIRQMLATLPGGVEIEVVVSVRDLARTIPAMWQENVQNWGSFTWSDYLDGVRREDRSEPGPGRAFWTRQDASRIVRTWGSRVGLDHVTLLTVPPRQAPPSLLWERFASIVPVDPSGLDLEVLANPSLGLPSLLMLGRLNQRLRSVSRPMSKSDYERVVKQMVSKRRLAKRTDEPRLGYDAPWVAERADLEIERLRDLGVRVVGDLEELRSAPVSGTDPDDVPLEAQLDAALEALAFVTTRLARETGSR